MDTSALIGLMQLADSAFPAGGFAHSSGLEQLVREGAISSADEIATFVRSLLRHSLATSDAVVAGVCAEAAGRDGSSSIMEADRALFVMKTTTELRSASTSMGRRMLREVSAHVAHPALCSFAQEIDAGATPGTLAAVYGVSGGVLGVPGEGAAAAFLLASATSMLHAAMRLLPISHRDVQRALHDLRPEIARLAALACTVPVGDLRSFHPLQEIASMRHRTATVRLFAS